jgi:tetratricopeptide (TPR) repeat protein
MSAAGRVRACAVLLAAALLSGFSPLEVEERNVREGNEALLSGDAAAALSRYDAAERAIGTRAAIDYDRGNALFRLGRPAEARDAWRQALTRGAGGLSSRALQNLASALDALGDREGAVAALRDALARDPRNEEARYNLEVLLRRRREAGGGAPRDPGPGGRGARDDPSAALAAGPDASAGRPGDAGEPGAGVPRPGSGPADRGGDRRDGAAGPAPRPAVAADPHPAADGDATRAAGARTRGPDGGAVSGGALRAPDGDKLLDALRAQERNPPLWSRVGRQGRRRDAEKDW